MTRPQRLGLGFLNRLGYWLKGVNQGTVELYNQALDLYEGERYEEATQQLYDEVRNSEGSDRLPEVFFLALALVRAMEPETEVEVKGRTESPLSLLAYVWDESRLVRDKVKHDLYATTMRAAEGLDPEKVYHADSQEGSVVSLLIRLWESDAPKYLENIVTRTSYLLEKTSEDDRRRFRDAMQLIQGKSSKELEQVYDQMDRRIGRIESRLSVLEMETRRRKRREKSD